ncbi:MAG: glycosyltransferase [Verrucomicrobiota bacterium]
MWRRARDGYVHPLQYEGFGMTILEAMACGLPVIATAWSGPADFLSPEWAYTLRHSAPRPEKAQDGAIFRYYVEPELDHLVDLMRLAYEREDESKALGQRASDIARSKWTWQHAAGRLASLFSLTPQSETAMR